MTNEIVGDDSRGEFVRVGPEQTQISLQVLQDIYNEITGKNESLTRRYRVNHQAEWDDFEELNSRVEQTLEQYHITSLNCSVTVFKVDDSKDVFSTFARFRASDRTSTSPVENIQIVYNFLIVLPKLQRPQPYKLSINVHSRVGLRERAKREMPIPGGMVRIFANFTGRFDIEYIDAAVARTLRAVADQWFDGLKQAPDMRLVGTLQGVSHYFPVAVRFLGSALVLIYVLMNADRISISDGDLLSLFLNLVLVGGVFVLVRDILYRVGNTLEQYVDQIQALSYVRFNRGDQQAIENFKQLNRSNGGGILGALGVAVLANVAAILLLRCLGVG